MLTWLTGYRCGTVPDLHWIPWGSARVDALLGARSRGSVAFLRIAGFRVACVAGEVSRGTANFRKCDFTSVFVRGSRGVNALPVHVLLGRHRTAFDARLPTAASPLRRCREPPQRDIDYAVSIL